MAVSTGEIHSRPNDGPDNPHRLADLFIAAGRPLRYWLGEFYRYAEGAYLPTPEAEIRAELTQFVRNEFVRVNADLLALWWQAGGQGAAPKVKPVTRPLIENVLQALRGRCLLSTAVTPPAWIDGASGPAPTGLVVVRNGILDLGKLADGSGDCLLPPSPSFFTTTAAPFDYDPAASVPDGWLKFLNDIWPDDRASIAALQEWFGYLLTPDTRHQKILFLLGPKRSGKGTIARVLEGLVGSTNVAGPTLGSLATPFGLAPLLGKTVATISDARLSGRSDAAVIVERLLSISGEDTLTIDRKHRDPVTVRLNTRFVILSNELPRLGDTSGAFAGRLILLRMTQSFFGQENPQLFDRLKTELPGILRWAVDGWHRLQEQGRLSRPASGDELASDMEDLCSPVLAFVRDRCIVEAGERIGVTELHKAWVEWCEHYGRKDAGTPVAFGRDLRTAVPTLGKSKLRSYEGRLHVYTGIRLRVMTDLDSPAETPTDGLSGHGGQSDRPLQAIGEEEVNAAMAGHSDHRDQLQCGTKPGH